MMAAIRMGSYADTFNLVASKCAKQLGKFQSMDAAGVAASKAILESKDHFLGEKMSFTLEVFGRLISGMIISGSHGYIAFTEDGGMVISRSYSESNLWKAYPELEISLVKKLLEGRSMGRWVALLDVDFINPAEAEDFYNQNIDTLSIVK